MKGKFFVVRQSLVITLLLGVFAGTALASNASNVAISYVRNALIQNNAKKALIEVISDDTDANSWITQDNNVIYSLCTLNVPESRNKKTIVIKNLERNTMKRAILKAETNIALYLDNGKLNRQIFKDQEAADYALRSSYSAKILGGLQSSANVIDKIAIALVYAPVNRSENIISNQLITENYCTYLYEKAQNSFSKGNYDLALETFRQIHYLDWANVKAYLGASFCFLKMNQTDDANKLASEVVLVMSGDMTPDEKVSAAKILFHCGNKDNAFKTLLDAYSSLKTK